MDLSDDESDYDEEKEATFVRNLEAEGALLAKDLLPNKSRRVYELAFAAFLKWHQENQSQKITENLLLAYFKELSASYSPPTLWSKYSMIKTLLRLRNGIDMGSFHNLKKFLQNFNKSYKAKKAAVFRWENIEAFLTGADNYIYLAMKVVLILGISGAMRCDEMVKMQVTDISDMSPPGQIMNEQNEDLFFFFVTIMDTKTYIPRSFVVGSIFYPFVRAYLDLRPPDIETQRFFIYYSKGRCTKQNIGKNRFGDISKCIASYLGIEESNNYTGHTYRRTAATLLANSGANLVAVKSLGGWLSDSVAQGYIENSDDNRKKIFRGITSANKTMKAFTLKSVMRQPTAISTEKQLKPAKLFKNCDKTVSPPVTNKLTVEGPVSARPSFAAPPGSKVAIRNKILPSSSVTKTTCTVTSSHASFSSPRVPISSKGISLMSITSPIVSSGLTAHSQVATSTTSSAHFDESNSLISTHNVCESHNEDLFNRECSSDTFFDSADTSNNNMPIRNKNQLYDNPFKRRRTSYSHQNSYVNQVQNENYQNVDCETSFVQFQNCTITNLTINKSLCSHGL